MEQNKPRRSGSQTAMLYGQVRYGRSRKLRVFLSSEMRSGSLKRERLAVADQIDAHPDAEAWLWERDADAGPYSSIEICREVARTSDILILIVADEITEPTLAEWEAATSGGVATAILIKNGG